MIVARTRTGALALVALALAACAGGRAPTIAAPDDPAAILVLEENLAPSDIHDLDLLRLQAAMGHHEAVRQTIGPRLARASRTAPDAGRDALRRLSIEIALAQGDARTAADQLVVLERDVERLGPAASAEERAIVALLYSDLAFRGRYYVDARKWSLRAISLLEGSGSPLFGDALRVLARNQLALNNPTQALEIVERASAALRQSRGVDEADLHELRLLRVDVFLTLHLTNEAVIAASDAYDGAVARFGGDSLPHAEALLAVAAATYAAGSLEAAVTIFGDAKGIFDALQINRPPTATFPVSERLAQRLDQLGELLPAADDADADAAE